MALARADLSIQLRLPFLIRAGVDNIEKVSSTSSEKDRSQFFFLSATVMWVNIAVRDNWRIQLQIGPQAL